jgi:predicted transcriptional regulator
VNFLQLSRSELVGAALVNLELILQLQLFQKPENSVASRLLEPRFWVNMVIYKDLGEPLPVESNFTALVVVRHFVEVVVYTVL